MSDEFVEISKLREKRPPNQQHKNPKDIAISISVTAGELLEVFELLKDYSPEHIRDNEHIMARIRKNLNELASGCRKSQSAPAPHCWIQRRLGACSSVSWVTPLPMPSTAISILSRLASTSPGSLVSSTCLSGTILAISRI